MTLPTLSLLVVEDDQVDLHLLRRSLRRVDASYALTTVQTLEAALECARAQSFDCVLLDWILPDGEGDTFLNYVMQEDPDLPVVVITGMDGEDLATDVLTHGAQEHLIKGNFDATRLLHAIRHSIERKRADDVLARVVKLDQLDAISQLAGGVAHEINNPLCWMTANLDFLQETLANSAPSEANDELLELLAETQEGLDRIASIVSALRAFSDASTSHLATLHLGEVVTLAARRVRPHLPEGCHLEVAPLHTFPRIRGDLDTLATALSHALLNSVTAITQAGASAQTPHLVRLSCVHAPTPATSSSRTPASACTSPTTTPSFAPSSRAGPPHAVALA